jgi:hypothetical protein
MAVARNATAQATQSDAVALRKRSTVEAHSSPSRTDGDTAADSLPRLSCGFHTNKLDVWGGAQESGSSPVPHKQFHPMMQRRPFEFGADGRDRETTVDNKLDSKSWTDLVDVWGTVVATRWKTISHPRRQRRDRRGFSLGRFDIRSIYEWAPSDLRENIRTA